MALLGRLSSSFHRLDGGEDRGSTAAYLPRSPRLALPRVLARPYYANAATAAPPGPSVTRNVT